MGIVTYREALNRAMVEEMEKDPKIFLMGEEVGHYQGAYKVSQGMLEKFGESRVIDTPISENGFSGIGVGAAMTGLRPIIEFMTWNFSLVAIDQIINSAAKLLYMSGGQFPMPIVFRGAGGVGGRLAAQHSQAFESWYAHVPGLKVVAPATPHDACGLLKSSILDNNPTIFIESEVLYGTKGEIPEKEYYIPIGKADIKRAGTDISIITWSRALSFSLEAAEDLAKEGIDVEVVDLRTLRPLDEQAIIESVRKTNRAVIVEEGWPMAGFGSHIAYVIQKEAFDYLDHPVERVTQQDVPMSYAANLERESLPNSTRIKEKNSFYVSIGVPMAKIAEMTQLSPTMSEGTIVNWLKKVGDTIAPGDILAEVETDKAVMEMEAYESGILLAILAEPGKKVAVGLPVAILGTANEDIAGLLNEAKNKLAIASSSANTPSLTKEPSKDQEAPAPIPIPTNLSSTNTLFTKPENSQMSTPPDKEENSSSVGKIENANQGKKITPITGRILASPLAKNLALEKSVDLKSIQGTGPGGRILESDVRAYLENPNLLKSSSSSKKMPQDHEIAVSGMRKVIAERLTSSKVNLPHFYLNIEVDADALVLFRERFNRSLAEIAPAESNSKISINDCIVKATSLSLKYHPKVNSSWKKDKILEWGRIDIGIAVSIEDGLITPVIRNANTSSLLEISQEIKSLADRAKKRKLKPEEFTNSTFTISNLGMYGISFFTAIINEPESAILAVGSIEEKPVVRNGMIQVGKILSLTLSCDHRVVDGAEGAKFLATLRKHLENPELLAS